MADWLKSDVLYMTETLNTLKVSSVLTDVSLQGLDFDKKKGVTFVTPFSEIGLGLVSLISLL